MQSACEGIDIVFHTAAFTALLGGSAATANYWGKACCLNVKGAKNLVDAGRQQGVRRLVHTSSVDVCFNGVEDLHMDKYTPYAKNFKCVYTETGNHLSSLTMVRAQAC